MSGATVAAALALACVVLAVAAAACARSSNRASASAQISETPSQSKINMWGARLLRAAKQLPNQTAHLGRLPEEPGMAVLHDDQRGGGAQCGFGVVDELLRIGRDRENNRSQVSEGESCLRSGHLVFHGAFTEGPVLPQAQHKIDSMDSMRHGRSEAAFVTKYMLILSKPTDGLSETLWNVTGNMVDTERKGRIEGFYNAETGQIVWTSTTQRVQRAAPSQLQQSLFYGSVVALTKPLAAPPPHSGEQLSEFEEMQRAVLSDMPLWFVHGSYVAEGNHMGSLLLFTDSKLSPKIAPGMRLAWREMGESVTTAHRALQIGRYQLQRLQLNPSAPTSHSFDATSRSDRLDSATQSPYVGAAKFFLQNGAARDKHVSHLLVDLEAADIAELNVLGSGSAGSAASATVSVTVSEPSATAATAPTAAACRVAAHSYPPPPPSVTGRQFSGRDILTAERTPSGTSKGQGRLWF